MKHQKEQKPRESLKLQRSLMGFGKPMPAPLVKASWWESVNGPVIPMDQRWFVHRLGKHKLQVLVAPVKEPLPSCTQVQRKYLGALGASHAKLLKKRGVALAQLQRAARNALVTYGTSAQGLADFRLALARTLAGIGKVDFGSFQAELPKVGRKSA